MAQRFGIVEVLGIMKIPLDGFNMGGPASAGGASLYASAQEDKYLKSLPRDIQYELATLALLMWWMDGDIQMWDGTKMSKRSKRAWRRMRKKDFYGGNLEQMAEPLEAGTAFGFKLETSDGTVRAQAAKQHYANEQLGNATVDQDVLRWQHIHWGTQYASEKMKKGMILGRIYRALDLTNKTDKEAKDNLKRVLAELILSPYDVKLLQKAPRQIEKESWFKMKDLIEFVEWSPEGIDVWGRRWDGQQRETKKKEAAALEAEGQL